MNITQVVGTERLTAGVPSDSNLYKLSARHLRRGVSCKLSAQAAVVAAEAVAENSPGEKSCGHWQSKRSMIQKTRRIHSACHSSHRA